jgi:mRNA interferase HigB
MHIITQTRLRLFWKDHPDSQSSLQLWFTRAKNADWQNISEIRRVYPSADRAGRLTVFNIHGNAYRLIVRIEYARQEIYIRHILTHAEYDKEDWKNDAWY